jgi:NAD(P)-dependent dehydrogenase (short-subunit alcohol dehydrogenase family)
MPLAAFGLVLGARQAVRRARHTDLRGQVAVITGSSRGLWLAIATELARTGCRVVLSARDIDELERARTHVERIGAEILAVPCDVTLRDQARNLIDQAVQRFGHVDILINNAGVISVGPLEAQTLEDFEHAMQVMLRGTVYPTLGALPSIRARRAATLSTSPRSAGR